MKTALLLLLLLGCTLHAEITYYELYEAHYAASQNSNASSFGQTVNINAPPVFGAGNNPLQDITQTDNTTSALTTSINDLWSAKSSLGAKGQDLTDFLEDTLYPIVSMDTNYGTVSGFTFGQMDLGTASFTLAYDFGTNGGFGTAIVLFRLVTLLAITTLFVIGLVKTVGSYL